MKKVMISFFITVTALFIFSSCAGTRSGYGCPTTMKSKPFRA